MTREDLIQSKEYIVSQFQLKLLNLIGNYKRENNLKDYQIAEKLHVSKGYISQILNATFDHKISKLVELALACDAVPIINFVDIDKYVWDDANDKYYELMPMIRPRAMTWEPVIPNIETEEEYQTKFSPVNVNKITTGQAEPVGEFEEVA